MDRKFGFTRSSTIISFRKLSLHKRLDSISGG